jgi:hypothetical protein
LEVISSPLGVLRVLAVLTSVAIGGCAITVRSEGRAVVHGHPVARAEVVPVEIATNPRVYYRGSYAYLVGARWYYPTAQGWVVFREEPTELARYRVEIDRGARLGRVPPGRDPP